MALVNQLVVKYRRTIFNFPVIESSEKTAVLIASNSFLFLKTVGGVSEKCEKQIGSKLVGKEVIVVVSECCFH